MILVTSKIVAHTANKLMAAMSIKLNPFLWVVY